jgi:hypothetical protein
MTATKTVAAPPPLYYLAIDGTNDLDAMTFGALLEAHRNWKNLATTYLRPRSEHPGYLFDPVHPFLPIPVVTMDGKSVAIVAPGGKDGIGKDPFWRHVESTAQGRRDSPVFGRHAEAEKSHRFMRQLILHPAVDIDRTDSAESSVHFADRKLPAVAERTSAVANLVYVSGHGWMGGYINGLELELWEDSSDPVTPVDARSSYFPSPYLFVGAAAEKGLGFHGPRWIILAVCSVLNMTTWPLWAEILANSVPHVRGILAYEEASPGPRPSARVARHFFSNLDAGMPFLDAWRVANEGKNWAAIIHKDALGDILARFRMFPSSGDTKTTAQRACYVGFGRSVPNGQPIYLKPEPFSVKIEHQIEGSWYEASAANLGWSNTALRDGGVYRISVAPPAGERIVAARLQLVHIRPTYSPQFTWSDVFGALGASRDISESGMRSSMLQLKPISPATELSFHLYARDNLRQQGLRTGYSYLWIRASITTDDTLMKYDFKTKGLIF